MSEITITTATILLALSTVLLLLITVGSYILFGNNQGNFIIVTSLLFAGIASYAAATDMGIPTSVRPNSMFRGNLSDTAAGMTSGLFAFIMALLFGIIMMVPPNTPGMLVLGFASFLASALLLFGGILAQTEYDE